MASVECSLRTKEPITGANDVTRIVNLERKKPLGDRLESEKQDSTAQNRPKIGEHRGGNMGDSAGAEAEGYNTHRRSRAVWKPEGGIRNVEENKDRNVQEDEQQIEQHLDE